MNQRAAKRPFYGTPLPHFLGVSHRSMAESVEAYASACPGREELPERGSERHHGNSADC